MDMASEYFTLLNLFIRGGGGGNGERELSIRPTQLHSIYSRDKLNKSFNFSRK